MLNPEVVIVPVIFIAPSLVILARMWFKHKERMATLGGTTTHGAALDTRLARIEEAVDAIAIEVERMGEGQRFVTKLLADRGAASLPETPKSSGSGQVITPH